jgi:hypothetical protein
VARVVRRHPGGVLPGVRRGAAVEPVHVLGIIGTTNVVQIGSCGSLQPELRTGDIVLSERATIGRGASQYYGGKEVAEANLGRVARAAALLAGRGAYVHRGRDFTTSRCCSSRRSCCAVGQSGPPRGRHGDLRGLLGRAGVPDASGVAAVRLGRAAAAVLDRRVHPEEEQAQARSAAAVYEVALQLA